MVFLLYRHSDGDVFVMMMMMMMIHQKVNYNLTDILDISEIIDILTSEDMAKICQSSPDMVSYVFYEWCIFQ